MSLNAIRAVPNYKTCTEVTAFCVVQATVLGYYPNFGANVFFAIVFGILTLGSGFLGIWKRTWTYAAALTVALGLETAGYAGRVLLSKNPWNNGAFQLQICAIILAPTLICAAIYLTLKHVALVLNPTISRIRPVWYPRIFLPADVTCLLVQGIGGGLAAAGGKDNQKLVNGGNNAIIAGVALQVVVLLAFGFFGGDYFLRVRKYMRSADAKPAALDVWRRAGFRRFLYAIAVAYACILIRCIYRIAEMAGGWGNHIMQDEPSFMVLDTSLVFVACSLLVIFHPGIYLPQMSHGHVYETENAAPVAESKEATANGGITSDSSTHQEP